MNTEQLLDWLDGASNKSYYSDESNHDFSMEVRQIILEHEKQEKQIELQKKIIKNFIDLLFLLKEEKL